MKVLQSDEKQHKSMIAFMLRIMFFVHKLLHSLYIFISSIINL